MIPIPLNGSPMFALDYDGVIADTNSLISQWLRDHLGMERPAYFCDWSQLSPVIGEARYREMGSWVYGEEGTALAEPVPGVEAALEALAAAGPVYLITARNEALTRYTRGWLDARGWLRYFTDVITQGERLKVDIAKGLGCRALVDDDQRHLIPGPVPKLVLFRHGMGRPAHPLDGCTVCSSWDDALACCLD